MDEAQIQPKEKIQNYLETHSQVSIGEICAVLSLSRTAVLYHLRKLCMERKVVRSKERSVSIRTKGQPKTLYSLAPEAYPDNLRQLASALLDVLKTNTSPQEYLLKAALSLSMPLEGPLFHRLNLTITRLNEMKYSAFWQARPSGPYIFLRNCPYAVLMNAHPELCELDTAIIERMLGYGVIQENKQPVDDSVKNSFCIFAVTNHLK